MLKALYTPISPKPEGSRFVIVVLSCFVTVITVGNRLQPILRKRQCLNQQVGQSPTVFSQIICTIFFSPQFIEDFLFRSFLSCEGTAIA